MPAVNYLFVYGSLRKALNGSLHALLKNQAMFLGFARIPGRLYLINCYPGLISTPIFRGFTVIGEVYRLHQPHRLLKVLDAYEECTADFPQPHEYKRMAQSVKLSDGRRLLCWVYIYNRPDTGLKHIIDGDFLSYLPDSHHSLRSFQFSSNP